MFHAAWFANLAPLTARVLLELLKRHVHFASSAMLRIQTLSPQTGPYLKIGPGKYFAKIFLKSISAPLTHCLPAG